MIAAIRLLWVCDIGSRLYLSWQERHLRVPFFLDHTGEGGNQARNRYEFGVKVSLAITHKQGLIVGAKRFVGKPFDGHKLVYRCLFNTT